MVVTEFTREIDCVEVDCFMVGGIREGYEDIRLQTRPLKLRGKEAVRPQLSRKSCAVIVCVPQLLSRTCSGGEKRVSQETKGLKGAKDGRRQGTF